MSTEIRVPQFKEQERDTQNRPNQTAQATAQATEIRVPQFKEQKRDTPNRPNQTAQATAEATELYSTRDSVSWTQLESNNNRI